MCVCMFIYMYVCVCIYTCKSLVMSTYLVHSTINYDAFEITETYQGDYTNERHPATLGNMESRSTWPQPICKYLRKWIQERYGCSPS